MYKQFSFRQLLILALFASFILIISACGASKNNLDAKDPNNTIPTNNSTGNQSEQSNLPDSTGSTDKTDKNEQSEQTKPVDQTDQAIRAMVLDYLQADASPGQNIYYGTDTGERAQNGDMVIQNLTFAGEARLYETIGMAYQIESTSYWFTRSGPDDTVGSYDWYPNDPFYIVLARSGYDDSLSHVIGVSYYIDPNKTIEEAIYEVAYNLMDINFSISFDHYAQLLGLGSSYIPLNEEFKSEIMTNYEPIYSEGSYWEYVYYDGLTVLQYYSADRDCFSINKIETSRTDLTTYKGARVGMTRDEIHAIYPEASEQPKWSYEGDYLWISNNMSVGPGFFMFLFFKDDQLAKIELINMFD